MEVRASGERDARQELIDDADRVTENARGQASVQAGADGTAGDRVLMDTRSARVEHAVWASVSVRLIAWLVDRVVVASPTLAFLAIAERLSPTPHDGGVHDGRSTTALALIVMTELFCQLLCNIAGTSVGKRLCRLRVIRLSDGGRPGFTPGLVRFLVAEVVVFTPSCLGEGVEPQSSAGRERSGRASRHSEDG
jgi:RDD family